MGKVHSSVAEFPTFNRHVVGSNPTAPTVIDLEYENRMKVTNEYVKVTLRLTVRAGMAISGPPLGPTLGQYGIPIGPFCESFNEQTKLFRTSFPLRVYLVLKWDGSYDYYIYMPQTTFFLKTILKIEQGTVSPPDAPQYYYYLQYLLLNVLLKRNSVLLSRVESLFLNTDVEDIAIRRRYHHFFKKGSFRSITPELLFESVSCYSIRELEINTVRSFSELRDYFLSDYLPLFLWMNYLEVCHMLQDNDCDYVQTDLLEEDSDTEETDEIISTGDTAGDTDVAEKEESHIFIEPIWYVDSIEDESTQESQSISLQSVCYVADLLVEIKRICKGELRPASKFTLTDAQRYARKLSDAEVAGMLMECLEIYLDHYTYIIKGFYFNSMFAEEASISVKNPLLSLGVSQWPSNLVRYVQMAEWVTMGSDACIFEFSMYVSVLFGTQPAYYTGYDFRNVFKFSSVFKNFSGQLKGQGIFITRKDAYVTVTGDSSEVRTRDFERRRRSRLLIRDRRHLDRLVLWHLIHKE